MKRSRLIGASFAAVFTLGFITSAQAMLVGRLPATVGGTDYQAYYDTTLDITWIANANLAASNTFGLATNTILGVYPGDMSGYDGIIYANGTMNWPGALHWIAAMNAAGGTGYLGFNDWRLPTMMDTGTLGCTDYSLPGTDCGYNVQTGSTATTVYSEMASLWYDTLGNLGYVDTSGNSNQTGWGLNNVGPFSNVQSDYYWSGLEYAPNVGSAWSFNANYGLQYWYPKVNFSNYYGWAVRTGDVSAVPVPAAIWLFGSGLLGLLGLARRQR